MNYAIVDNSSNLVTNITLWDGISSWAPPTGSTAVEIPSGQGVGLGWIYSGGIFSAPDYWYSTIDGNLYEGEFYLIGAPMAPIYNPQPSDSTSSIPPTSSQQGQSLYWTGSAWVLASFDITLSLADAKTSLINTTNADGAAAVNAEVGLYSGVQLITAPDVNALETKTYQPTTLGEYQAYVDGQTAATVAQINAAVATDELYGINPAAVPFSPTQLPSGTLNTGRGGSGSIGPLDINMTYFSVLAVEGSTAADLELYIPGTNTTLSYNSGLPDPFTFDSIGNCFTTGDYRLVIRYSGGGAVLGTIIVPLGANTNVAWTYNPTIPPA
jgi:hypothetical protein